MSTAATGKGGWSAEAVDTLIRMAGGGYTDAEIGRTLRVSAAAVGRKRRTLKVAAGVPPRMRISVARRALISSGHHGPRTISKTSS